MGDLGGTTLTFVRRTKKDAGISPTFWMEPGAAETPARPAAEEAAKAIEESHVETRGQLRKAAARARRARKGPAPGVGKENARGGFIGAGAKGDRGDECGSEGGGASEPIARDAPGPSGPKDAPAIALLLKQYFFGIDKVELGGEAVGTESWDDDDERSSEGDGDGEGTTLPGLSSRARATPGAARAKPGFEPDALDAPSTGGSAPPPTPASGETRALPPSEGASGAAAPVDGDAPDVPLPPTPHTVRGGRRAWARASLAPGAWPSSPPTGAGARRSSLARPSLAPGLPVGRPSSFRPSLVIRQSLLPARPSLAPRLSVAHGISRSSVGDWLRGVSSAIATEGSGLDRAGAPWAVRRSSVAVDAPGLPPGVAGVPSRRPSVAAPGGLAGDRGAGGEAVVVRIADLSLEDPPAVLGASDAAGGSREGIDEGDEEDGEPTPQGNEGLGEASPRGGEGLGEASPRGSKGFGEAPPRGNEGLGRVAEEDESEGERPPEISRAPTVTGDVADGSASDAGRLAPRSPPVTRAARARGTPTMRGGDASTPRVGAALVSSPGTPAALRLPDSLTVPGSAALPESEAAEVPPPPLSATPAAAASSATPAAEAVAASLTPSSVLRLASPLEELLDLCGQRTLDSSSSSAGHDVPDGPKPSAPEGAVEDKGGARRTRAKAGAPTESPTLSPVSARRARIEASLPSMDELLSRHVCVSTIRKIGEGTFGEAFAADRVLFPDTEAKGGQAREAEVKKKAGAASGRAKKVGAADAKAKKAGAASGKAKKASEAGTEGAESRGELGQAPQLPAPQAAVVKIVPMDGDEPVNGEVQRTSAEMAAEAAIACALSAFRRGLERGEQAPNATAGFVETIAVGVCRGRYSQQLRTEWTRWDEERGSENDDPSIFGDSQLYCVFVLGNGGRDLEAAALGEIPPAPAPAPPAAIAARPIPSAAGAVARSILLQTALVLAVAEQGCEFEHRDLHWGNVLVAPTTEETLSFRLRGVDVRARSCGVRVTLIDFTLSRLRARGAAAAAYCDLGSDPAIFAGPKGDPQADAYRRMRTVVGSDWSRFEPATNAIWLAYLSRVLEARKLPVELSRERAALRAFGRRAAASLDAAQLIWDELFAGLWEVVEAEGS